MDWFLLVSKEEMGQVLEGIGWTVRRFIDSEDAGYAVILKKVA